MARKTMGSLDPESLKELIVSTLDSNKADDIEVIDLEENSYIADYMIVASGRSSRQVVALANKVLDQLSETAIKDIRKEGFQTGDWVVLDTGDVILHIFRPEVRGFYNIEKMWGGFTDFATVSQTA